MMDCFSAMTGFGNGGSFTLVVALLAAGTTYFFMKQPTSRSEKYES